MSVSNFQSLHRWIYHSCYLAASFVPCWMRHLIRIRLVAGWISAPRVWNEEDLRTSQGPPAPAVLSWVTGCQCTRPRAGRQERCGWVILSPNHWNFLLISSKAVSLFLVGSLEEHLQFPSGTILLGHSWAVWHKRSSFLRLGSQHALLTELSHFQIWLKVRDAWLPSTWTLEATAGLLIDLISILLCLRAQGGLGRGGEMGELLVGGVVTTHNTYCLSLVSHIGSDCDHPK